MLRVRLMTPADLEPVFELQCRAHAPDYHEPRSALTSRFDHGRRTCFVAERGHRPVAYLLAHPWAGAPPILHRALHEQILPRYLFLHDLAVAPDARGSGAARVLVSHLMQQCRATGFDEVRLVALSGADDFWRRHGWSPIPGQAPDRCYGRAARIMRRGLPRMVGGFSIARPSSATDESLA